MPDALKVHCLVLDYTIDAAITPTNDNPVVKELDSELRRWGEATQLTSFEFRETAPLVFNYEIDHDDTRHIEGVFDFTANPLDPTITIDCPDPWALSEFLRARLRDAIIQAVVKFGMTDLEVTFLT